MREGSLLALAPPRKRAAIAARSAGRRPRSSMLGVRDFGRWRKPKNWGTRTVGTELIRLSPPVRCSTREGGRERTGDGTHHHRTSRNGLGLTTKRQTPRARSESDQPRSNRAGKRCRGSRRRPWRRTQAPDRPHADGPGGSARISNLATDIESHMNVPRPGRMGPAVDDALHLRDGLTRHPHGCATWPAAVPGAGSGRGRIGGLGTEVPSGYSRWRRASLRSVSR